MYYQKIQVVDGDYIHSDGKRYTVTEARNVRPTDGWTRFDSLEECLNAWGLTYDLLPELQARKYAEK